MKHLLPLALLALLAIGCTPESRYLGLVDLKAATHKAEVQPTQAARLNVADTRGQYRNASAAASRDLATAKVAIDAKADASEPLDQAEAGIRTMRQLIGLDQ